MRALVVEAFAPFEIHAISMDAYTLPGVKQLEDQGVTDSIIGFRNAYEPDTTPLQQKIDSINALDMLLKA